MEWVKSLLPEEVGWYVVAERDIARSLYEYGKKYPLYVQLELSQASIPYLTIIEVYHPQWLLALEHVKKQFVVWATRSAQDQYGYYAEFKYKNVVQRMRWIKPGRFLMGAPENEQGRFDEEQQHEVILTRGFWLADTACTQALWLAVMGSDNPAYFKGHDNPVEQVSWNDVQEFLAKLNRAVPGLNVRLPTEAEWEYACRAGTKAATYTGDLEILGENNAPVLDAAAWYGGNSGVDFDLEKGYDSSSWLNKQYPHNKAGTHPVGRKQPNAWGLYDMLGNVWEWCQDWYGAYPQGVVNDPVGPDTGTWRVYRGGAWSSYARYVRAAYRNYDVPAYRIVNQGFRCARI